MSEEHQNIITYQSHDGRISFNVNIFAETIWLTQKQMAELFDKERSVIAKHINNIFKEGELIRKDTCANFAQVQKEGDKTVTRNIEHYNLDIIISVGYRVKSARGTQFRIWATQILKQYLINGYVINEDKVRAIIREELAKVRIEHKEEIHNIYNTILEIAKKPIIIHNNISLASERLETKIITLLDELIIAVQDNKNIVKELEQVRNIVKDPAKTQKAKSKLVNFFAKLGNNNSELNKAIKGVGITKKIITELIKLGEKLKDLI